MRPGLFAVHRPITGSNDLDRLGLQLFMAHCLYSCGRGWSRYRSRDTMCFSRKLFRRFNTAESGVDHLGL